MRHLIWVGLLAGLFALVGGTTVSVAQQPGDFGTIKGQVKLTATPESRKIDVNNDKEHCTSKGALVYEDVIVDKETKKKTVMEEAKLLQADLRAVVSVGDGANDIPMLQTAGTGVGYFGKPAVVAATPHQIRHTDLTAILYMQGYRKQEIGE